jgi:hypothetical protein
MRLWDDGSKMWNFESVCARDYESVRPRVRETMGLWVYVSTGLGVWVCGCVGVWECGLGVCAFEVDGLECVVFGSVTVFVPVSMSVSESG